MLPSSRDVSLDVLRAACTIVVVALHATMAGILITHDGVAIGNALEMPGFWPFSWVLQIMPLFFLAGGATAAAALRRAGARGGAPFTAGRVLRLMRPAVPAFAAIAVGLALLGAFGTSAGLVSEAGFRVSQPLWFLGVFVLVQALAPLLLRAHGRRPWVALAVLAGSVVAVDIARAATGIDAIGFANLALVWLAVQQIGFFLADGWFARLGTRMRLVIAAGGLAGIPALAAAGLGGLDMYENLNPPTTALVLLGVAQASLFSLAQPRLRVWGAGGRLGAVTRFIGARAMAIYLWHMPALIVVAALVIAASLATGAAVPAPLSGEWWATRPAWILAVAAATLAAVAIAARSRADRSEEPTARAGRAAAATALAVAAIAVVFVRGLDVSTAVLTIALALMALRLARVPAAQDPSVGGRRAANIMPWADAPRSGAPVPSSQHTRGGTMTIDERPGRAMGRGAGDSPRSKTPETVIAGDLDDRKAGSMHIDLGAHA